MAKQVHLKYNEKEYTLGFTLATVRTMEQAGFIIGEIGDKPAVRVPELFYGAFQANHRGIKRSLVDDIWKSLKRKDDLAAALVEMYAEAREAILEEGNEDWTVSE